MSLRQQQKRKMQPILHILHTTLRQNPREIASQEHINQDIVQELLQDDSIARTHSLPALRLLAYELILLISQHPQSQPQSCPHTTDCMHSLPRISKLLQGVQEVLRDLAGQTVIPQRTARNKQRIFSTYYHQFCALTEEIQRKKEGSECAEDALIDQLESLVFKKETIIETLQRERDAIRERLQQAQRQFLELQQQQKCLFKEKLQVQEERERLKQELLQLVRFSPENTFEQEAALSENHCFWGNAEKSILPTSTQIGSAEGECVQSELLMCLLSQALTIQALLQ